MIGPLDTSVNIAFPHIVADFDQPMKMTQWVVICYVLTYASLMLVFGKLGDLYGQRRIFFLGLMASIFALALISLADSFNTLLFFRFNKNNILLCLLDKIREVIFGFFRNNYNTS